MKKTRGISNRCVTPTSPTSTSFVFKVYVTFFVVLLLLKKKKKSSPVYVGKLFAYLSSTRGQGTQGTPTRNEWERNPRGLTWAVCQSRWHLTATYWWGCEFKIVFWPLSLFVYVQPLSACEGGERCDVVTCPLVRSRSVIWMRGLNKQRYENIFICKPASPVAW